MKQTEKKRTLQFHFHLSTLVVILIVIAVVVGISGMLSAGKRDKQPPEVITVSSLQEIVNVSELSTYTAVYNGIAQVMNEANPEQTDYYVSYEAKVYAGIDFEQIQISVDDQEKKIVVKLPEVTITKVDVDIASMDFIFYNNSANTSTVSQAAYKACEADAQEESAQQKAIYELARQNACNVLKALIQPLVEQVDAAYTLSVS